MYKRLPWAALRLRVVFFVGISASLWVGGYNEIREVREIRDCP